MDTSAFPDWRRIGHRIGKRLKDVLDPQPTNPGPSPEECKAQRIRDSFKGLVYFDNFAEVEAWSESDIDPIQQANQPLLFRHSSQVHDDIGSKTKLTLCHDYKGGYHDYESVRPDPLSTELYSCKYLQFVDTFIYFSHKLVCVPPPSWSNVLHRNGSKVLGTFLIEPQTDDVERLMLKRNGKYLLATRLAEMATGYGFDGWLLNVEKDAPEDYPRWSQELTAFILELRGNLGEDKAVIWYDALTVEGDVYYQNGLTPSNRLYAMAADGIFTNYKWTDKHLASTKASATAAGMSTSKIFFGIDVWAQNTNMPGPPRVTYPAEGGGGTNTGLAMSTLSTCGFGSAVFAPAWTYEHFSTSDNSHGLSRKEPSIAEQVNQSMWTGASLPDELFCDCRKGRPHHTYFYKRNPIVQYAHEYPAGSETFFETSFTQAFQPQNTIKPKEIQTVGCLPCLGSQDPLPNLLPLSARDWAEDHKGPITRVLYAELGMGSYPSLTVFTKLAGCYEEAEEKGTPVCLRLFKLNMPADGSLEAKIELEVKDTSAGTNCGIYLTYMDTSSQSLTDERNRIPLGKYYGNAAIRIPIHHSAGRLVELGVFSDGDPGVSAPLSLMELSRIVIKPRGLLRKDFKIWNIRVCIRSRDNFQQTRIVWDWITDPLLEQTWSELMPWSLRTGPFRSFTVHIGGEAVGEAHCLEMPVTQEDLQHLEGVTDGVEIQVEGHLFGGDSIRSPDVIVPKADFDRRSRRRSRNRP